MKVRGDVCRAIVWALASWIAVEAGAQTTPSDPPVVPAHPSPADPTAVPLPSAEPVVPQAAEPTAPASAQEPIDAAADTPPQAADTPPQAADASAQPAPTDAAATRTPEVIVTGPLAAPSAQTAEEIYASSGYYGPDPGAKLTRKIVLLDGRFEAGGEMALVTSDAGAPISDLDVTDLALLRLRLRRSFGGVFELLAATQLLAKQPDALDANVFQGAVLGARAEVIDGWAIGVHGGSGPLMHDDGFYLRPGVDVITKQAVDRHVQFELNAGYDFTVLDFADVSNEGFTLHELTFGAEASMGWTGGGVFVGLGYRVPIYSTPDKPVTGLFSPSHLNPDTQLNVQVGCVFAVGRHHGWDLYAVYTIIDRGEANDPTSMLPIVDGGFDQQQILLGVQHRFGRDFDANRH